MFSLVLQVLQALLFGGAGFLIGWWLGQRWASRAVFELWHEKDHLDQMDLKRRMDRIGRRSVPREGTSPTRITKLRMR